MSVDIVIHTENIISDLKKSESVGIELAAEVYKAIKSLHPDWIERSFQEL